MFKILFVLLLSKAVCVYPHLGVFGYLHSYTFAGVRGTYQWETKLFSC